MRSKQGVADPPWHPKLLAKEGSRFAGIVLEVSVLLEEQPC